MAFAWSAVNQVADYVTITVGIAALIIRQFIWRSTDLHPQGVCPEIDSV